MERVRCVLCKHSEAVNAVSAQAIEQHGSGTTRWQENWWLRNEY
jgi:hypothetical protein